jgi:dihydrofolate reductase
MIAFMRKAILGLGISLDGYIARPDGGLDFLFMPKDYSMAPFFETIDVSIMGRKTMDVALRLGHGGGEGGGASSMETYVMSKSQPPGPRHGAIYTSETPKELLARIRRKKKGKNIWLAGGGEIAREFLKADLVDELYLGVVPVLIGEGIPIFPSGYPQRNFELLENKTYSKGMIALRYQRTVRGRAK